MIFSKSAPYKISGWCSLGLVLLLIMLSACNRTPPVSVDPKNPKSPQYAYQPDEIALLRIITSNIQDLEKKKQYTKIYDQYGSQAFKRQVPRRQFLMLTNCVETYLGDLVEYDQNDLGFHRSFDQRKAKRTIDYITRQVLRNTGPVKERMLFVWEGSRYKLHGFYWIAKDPNFLQCVQQAENPPKQEPAVQPTADGAKPAEKPSQAEPESTIKKVSDTAKPEETAKPATATTQAKPAPAPSEQPAPETAKPDSVSH